MLTPEQKLQTTVFFIEANSFEQLSLWKEFKTKTNWQEDNHGFFQQIGCIDNDTNKPVFVSFSFALIYGKRICFYDITSRFNDTTMVEDWLKTNYPIKWDNESRIALTNAMNFHHALDHCKLTKKIR